MVKGKWLMDHGSWIMVSWMIRGGEGGNARGARLQYFVLARFAGSVGE
jgi:hypothetical protein